MSKKYITVGALLTLIFAVSFTIWILNFTGKAVANPTNPELVEDAALKMVDEATPPQVSLMMKLAPLGEIGGILIVLILIFWGVIMKFKIPLS